MKDDTIKALIEFITDVEELAYSVRLVTGEQTARDLVGSAEALKEALKHDESLRSEKWVE